MNYSFLPNFQLKETSSLTLDDPNEIIMLCGADINFAIRNGGELTQNLCLDLIQNEEFVNDYKKAKMVDTSHEIIIDTRLSMLMKGMYPSIPGWHCDWVPRTGNINNQPDLKQDISTYKHWAILISQNPVSGTEFLNTKIEIDLDENLDQPIWQQVHKKINKSHERIKIPNNTWVRFDSQTIHRSTKAITNGWRLFFRASIVKAKSKNIIRKQTQVYLESESTGW